MAKTVEPRAQDGAVKPAFLLHILAGVLNGVLGGRRHVLHLQVLDVHTAVLLRERMRRILVEILSNATNLSGIGFDLSLSRHRLRLGCFLSKGSARPNFASFFRDS